MAVKERIGGNTNKQSCFLSFKADAISSLMRVFRDISVKAALRRRETGFSRMSASTLFLLELLFLASHIPPPPPPKHICISTFCKKTKQLG